MATATTIELVARLTKIEQTIEDLDFFGSMFTNSEARRALAILEEHIADGKAFLNDDILGALNVLAYGPPLAPARYIKAVASMTARALRARLHDDPDLARAARHRAANRGN